MKSYKYSSFPLSKREVTFSYFFKKKEMLLSFNATIMTQVPKSISVDSMTKFRPISCCTVFYKCVTKILASRMKPYLSRLISKSQSAFIGGRSISDNVFMAKKLVNR